MFNRKLVAAALLKIARLVAYTPIRKKETDERNRSWNNMVTAYVPKLYATAVVKAKAAVDADGYDAMSVRQVKSDYLLYRDEAKNSNKYHYYTLLDIRCDDGKDRYAAVNCYGRVGFIEGTQILGKRVSDYLSVAESEYSKHYSAKTRKGYQPIKLQRG